MSVCTDCNKINLETNTVLQNEEQGCSTTVHEEVCVQATVTIEPNVEPGEIKCFCIDNPTFDDCPGILEDYCEFTVSQRICVEIPLTFSAAATTEPDGIVCGEKEIGSCPGTTACTHTIGFFKNHEVVTEELLNLAGGSITLGIEDDGLSYTVTTINEAIDVLSFNTPSPPAPADPPYKQQYQNLYAQLLAANLNIIAIALEGVEICEFAIEAIENANNFLASSEDPIPGAPDFQEPLEEFNSGEAPGCPMHCDD